MISLKDGSLESLEFWKAPHVRFLEQLMTQFACSCRVAFSTTAPFPASTRRTTNSVSGESDLPTRTVTCEQISDPKWLITITSWMLKIRRRTARVLYGLLHSYLDEVWKAGLFTSLAMWWKLGDWGLKSTAWDHSASASKSLDLHMRRPGSEVPILSTISY